MLIQMLVHQPLALGAVVQQTPYWVWALLAGLVALGASQMRERHVGLRRAMAMPAVFAALAMAGVGSAFATGGQAPAALAAWLLAAICAATLALRLEPTAPRGARYWPQARSFYLPGSAMPLVLILGVFLTKYFVGVELALQPALAQSREFAVQIGTLYGLFSGMFVARALRLWRLARASAVPPTPAGLPRRPA